MQNGRNLVSTKYTLWDHSSQWCRWRFVQVADSNSSIIEGRFLSKFSLMKAFHHFENIFVQDNLPIKICSFIVVGFDEIHSFPRRRICSLISGLASTKDTESTLAGLELDFSRLRIYQEESERRLMEDWERPKGTSTITGLFINGKDANRRPVYCGIYHPI